MSAIVFVFVLLTLRLFSHISLLTITLLAPTEGRESGGGSHGAHEVPARFPSKGPGKRLFLIIRLSKIFYFYF